MKIEVISRPQEFSVLFIDCDLATTKKIKTLVVEFLSRMGQAPLASDVKEGSDFLFFDVKSKDQKLRVEDIIHSLDKATRIGTRNPF